MTGRTTVVEDNEWAEQAKASFLKYDANGDGCIDEEELGLLLTAVSDKFTKKDIGRMLREADGNGDNRIQFSEFINWLSLPAKESLGGAALTYSKGLEHIFNVYDKEGSGRINAKHFQECHVILQASARIAEDDDLEKVCINSEIERDKEEAMSLITGRATNGMIGFMDFLDWMRQHIPEHMDQDDFFDYADQIATSLEETFQHDFSMEADYAREKDDVLQHIAGKLSAEMKGIGLGRRASTLQPSPWDLVPAGLSTDRLKAAVMMANPLNMRAVKDISWEVLCCPKGDAGAETWLAQVVRRVVMKSNGKVKVEQAIFYRYKGDSGDWVSAEPEDCTFFDLMEPGLGVYALLKTVCNFGLTIRWREIETALEGAVDMRLIRDDDLDAYNEHMRELVLNQLEEDGCKKFAALGSRDEKLKYVERYLSNELNIPAGMVMASLLKLHIVEKHSAWEAFIGVC